MYVCPDCKGRLADYFCATCKVAFDVRCGVPDLLSRDARFGAVRDISRTYDRIYAERAQVWEDQGRTPDFVRYFADLTADFSQGTLLEIGCGEGFLLEQLRAEKKLAVDISHEALLKAMRRSGASGAIALAERLPFPDQSFDVVVSVGVMEHFIDDRAAISEVARVLKPRGFYITLIHVKRSAGQKATQKVREYLWPSFRPRALVRWVFGKIYRPIHQPIQRQYSVADAAQTLRRAGLELLRTINLASDPAIPLVGPHVVIYVARTPALPIRLQS